MVKEEFDTVVFDPATKQVGQVVRPVQTQFDIHFVVVWTNERTGCKVRRLAIRIR
jgi:hypothetical protein